MPDDWVQTLLLALPDPLSAGTMPMVVVVVEVLKDAGDGWSRAGLAAGDGGTERGGLSCFLSRNIVLLQTYSRRWQ